MSGVLHRSFVKYFYWREKFYSGFLFAFWLTIVEESTSGDCYAGRRFLWLFICDSWGKVLEWAKVIFMPNFRTQLVFNLNACSLIISFLPNEKSDTDKLKKTPAVKIACFNICGTRKHMPQNSKITSEECSAALGLRSIRRSSGSRDLLWSWNIQKKLASL